MEYWNNQFFETQHSSHVGANLTEGYFQVGAYRNTLMFFALKTA
jgi:hypothetical protein